MGMNKKSIMFNINKYNKIMSHIDEYEDKDIKITSQKGRVGCCRIYPCRGKRQMDSYKKNRRKFYFFVKIRHIKCILNI